MSLPNGWKKVKLGDCFDVQLGKMLNKNAREQKPQYPYIANVNVRWGSLNTEQLPTMYFSEREKEKFALKKDDILMCEGGEIGRCSVLKESLNNVFYQKACHRLRAKNNLCTPDFLYFYIDNYVTSREIVGLVGESSIAHLPAEKVVQIQLNLPPLEEQKKIAATLSVWDSAIEKMEKLIEAKSEQKKTLTYKLIENQNDVKFKLGNIAIDKSKWKKKKFKDVFEFLPTNTYSREQMSNDEGSIKNIHYGDVLVKYAELLDVNSARIPCLKSSVDSSKMTFLQSGDIVIADTAEDETVGKAVEILNIKNHLVVSGLHTMLCRAQKEIFYHGWLGYYINSKEFHRQLIPLITGIKVSSIAKKDIVDTFILIPSIQEQKIIVETLSETNKEISLLKQQLENYKKQKQGLMQKLLTGQWRVK